MDLKKRIAAVLMGGDTSEYDISIKSGTFVWEQLCEMGLLAYKVIIKGKMWSVLDAQGVAYDVDKNDFSAVIDGQKIKFDHVFNLIHGSPGEDGRLAAYFELIGMPHNTANSYALALTYHKKDCLAVVTKMGIPTARSLYFDLGDAICSAAIAKEIGFPCFIKPNQGGSSLGMSKVYDKAGLATAIEKAFKEDNSILVESFLAGTEVSVGAFQDGDKINVLPITEIVSENDFFDYEAKYEGKSQEITPARLSKTQEKNVIASVQKIYKKLNIKGFSRSEFIFVGDTPYFLEMNTIPGMTRESLLPQQIAAAGLDLKAVLGSFIKKSHAS